MNGNGVNHSRRCRPVLSHQFVPSENVMNHSRSRPPVNYETTTISEHMLRIPASQCRLVLDQESFYRFGKALSDSAHPHRQSLLESSSGLYYLMAILMSRVGEETKSEHYFNQCIAFPDTKGDSKALNAFYYADFALLYYRMGPTKMDKALQNIEIARKLSSEGYVSLVSSIVKGQEKGIQGVIAYLDTVHVHGQPAMTTLDDDEKSSGQSGSGHDDGVSVTVFSLFGRVLYAEWLAKQGEYAKSLEQYEVMMKQFGRSHGDGESMLMNGALYYQYGKVLMQQKRVDEAKEMFYAALKTEPCLPNVHEQCNVELKAMDSLHDPKEFLYRIEDHDAASDRLSAVTERKDHDESEHDESDHDQSDHDESDHDESGQNEEDEEEEQESATATV